jgi:adenine-specific DNA-methyltransferase
MDGISLTPQEEKLNALKQILPEIFTEGKIDWEKLQATLGEDINFTNERYVLNWAGKSDAFKVLQAPTSKTLIPAKGESINFDTTQHIFIEGENMEVLKVLQKSYFGKVKMIYIDPPYNTGNDSFVYPDKFSETKANYEKRVGDTDEDGNRTKDGLFKKNSKENGQYHSNWLNMMMPRLYLAKNLLRQDGVIFVSIDDNEVHNLRLLMNEIFGEENFVANIIWQKKYAVSNDDPSIAAMHDYIICFQKSEKFQRALLPRTDKQLKRYSNPDSDRRGLWASAEYVSSKTKVERPTLWYPIKHPKTGEEVWPDESAVWRYSKDKHSKMVMENRLFWGPDFSYKIPRLKRFLSEIQNGLVPSTWWDFNDVGHNDEGQKETALLIGRKVFSTPKPIRLLKKILRISVKAEDLILDFFAGSGTTAHAVMGLNAADGGNRKYICVQLPELTDEKSEAYKAGYPTIAEISKERIRRAGKKIKEEIESEIQKLATKIAKLKGELPTEETKAEITSLESKILGLKSQDLGFKVLKLEDSNFKQWQQLDGRSAEALAEQMRLFIDPVSATATTANMVYELLLKSGKDLNSQIDSRSGYFLINSNELALILEKVDQSIITAVMGEKPKKVIALDKLFQGNDQLKTNTVLQMKDAGIEFKTI